MAVGCLAHIDFHVVGALLYRLFNSREGVFRGVHGTAPVCADMYRILKIVEGMEHEKSMPHRKKQ